MTYSTSPHVMPGAYLYEQSNEILSTPQTRGAKSHFFQPPRTPSASSSLYLGRSSISVRSIDSENQHVTSRKRGRNDFTSDSFEKQVIRSRMRWTSAGDPTSPSVMMDVDSLSSLASHRYQLAGALDTPGAAAAEEEEDDDDAQTDVGYRRRLAPADLRETYGGTESTKGYTNGDAAVDQENSILSLAREGSSGWSQVAFQLVGGVVGKMWEFCKTNAFKGFYAGGGQGYNMPLHDRSSSHTDVLRQERMMNFDKADAFEVRATARSSEPDRGLSSRDSTPPRPAKRRIVESGDNELGNNWIIVPPANTAASLHLPARSQPVPRLQTRHSMPTGTNGNRRSVALNLSPRAFQRRTSQTASRATRATRVSHAGSPGQLSSRPASFASQRSPPLRTHNNYAMNDADARPLTPQNSAMTDEAMKWAARRRREEQDADASMRRLNKQLQDMIREGREALGSTIEVDFDDDEMIDEGFEDGYAQVTKIGGAW